jgi:hypothetical protein
MVKTVAAILGLLTAAVGIVFALDPSLRPDPRTTQAATLKAVALDEGATVWDYARRLGDTSPLRFPNACAPGSIVYVQENIEGFKSRHTQLRFVTYDATTGARLDDPGTHSTMQGENTLALASGAPSDQSVSLSWVEWPLHPQGRYFVRFELFEGDVFLGLADTHPFTVTAKQWHAALDRCLAAHALGHAPFEGGLVEGRVGAAAGGFAWGRWLPLAGIAAFACALGVLIGRRRPGQSGEAGDE